MDIWSVIKGMMKYALRMSKIPNEELNLDTYTDIEKLKEDIKPYLESYFMMRDEYEKLETERAALALKVKNDELFKEQEIKKIEAYLKAYYEELDAQKKSHYKQSIIKLELLNKDLVAKKMFHFEQEIKRVEKLPKILEAKNKKLKENNALLQEEIKKLREEKAYQELKDCEKSELNDKYSDGWNVWYAKRKYDVIKAGGDPEKLDINLLMEEWMRSC